MRYNLYLTSIVSTTDDVKDAVMRDDLKCDSVLASSCGVIIKVDESYKQSDGVYGVIFKVHGLKNTTVEDMISEADDDVNKLVGIISDYIGVALNVLFVNNCKYHIDYTDFNRQ